MAVVARTVGTPVCGGRVAAGVHVAPGPTGGVPPVPPRHPEELRQRSRVLHRPGPHAVPLCAATGCRNVLSNCDFNLVGRGFRSRQSRVVSRLCTSTTCRGYPKGHESRSSATLAAPFAKNCEGYTAMFSLDFFH